MPKIDFKDLTYKTKEKIKQGTKWTLEKVKSTIKYVKENPQEAAAIAGAAVTITGGVSRVIRSVNRHRTIRQEKHHREREIYDRWLNMYLTTKRKLTKRDVDRINSIMRETGKRKSEVLSELNLLKR